MLTFYKIDAKHAHHWSPPQYINTSQYMQQRPNTIYHIGCQLLRIANTNIYLDTSVLIPVLRFFKDLSRIVLTNFGVIGKSKGCHVVAMYSHSKLVNTVVVGSHQHLKLA